MVGWNSDIKQTLPTLCFQKTIRIYRFREFRLRQFCKYQFLSSKYFYIDSFVLSFFYFLHLKLIHIHAKKETVGSQGFMKIEIVFSKGLFNPKPAVVFLPKHSHFWHYHREILWFLMNSNLKDFCEIYRVGHKAEKKSGLWKKI